VGSRVWQGSTRERSHLAGIKTNPSKPRHCVHGEEPGAGAGDQRQLGRGGYKGTIRQHDAFGHLARNGARWLRARGVGRADGARHPERASSPPGWC